jgi:hypothetical protein
MKRTVGEADCRHAVGLTCHEEGCSSAGLQACCRRGRRGHAMKRAVVVEDCRHAVGEAAC